VTAYAALLRGINLGPSNKIAMPALRALAVELGYEHVATYINSGNLTFTSTKKAATLERELAAAIKAEFGFSIDVAVRTKAQLAKAVAGNPYPDGEPSKVTVAFLTKAAPATAEERVAAVATEHEPFTFAGLEVYVHYSDGIANSKLAVQFSKIIGVSATVRNIRTVAKILEQLDR
jgi:uncharacterized protein (DUF1697 family)